MGLDLHIRRTEEKIDLSKFDSKERRVLLGLARFADEVDDSMEVSNIPYSHIAQQIRGFDSDNPEGKFRYLTLQPDHINSMINVIQDYKDEIEDHYSEVPTSGHADTVVRGGGQGMMYRDLEGIEGLMDNGIRRT